MTRTHEISADGRSIKCLDCGMTSFNPNDVRWRYCGNCHEFHEIKQMVEELEVEMTRLCATYGDELDA